MSKIYEVYNMTISNWGGREKSLLKPKALKPILQKLTEKELVVQ